MRTWLRAGKECTYTCGRCAAVIAVGDPVLKIAGPTWTVFRCGLLACAGEAIPEHLPWLPEPSSAMTPLVKIGRGTADELPLDWKRQQAGKDS